jgi:hypothetical protein
MTGDDLRDDALDPLLADLRPAYGRRASSRAPSGSAELGYQAMVWRTVE